jgi:hypothetical protein
MVVVRLILGVTAFACIVSILAICLAKIKSKYINNEINNKTMNISKKALMSVLMALTSLVSMAQPYYHVMKRDGINQTEEAVYDAKT